MTGPDPAPAPAAPAAPPRSALRRRVEIVLAVAGVLLALVYPFLVYLGMMHLGARELGLVLLALNVPFIVARARRLDGQAIRTVLEAPIIIAALATITVVLDDVRAILALPVLINAALLFTFARSLRGERSIVEHFARLMVKDLSPEERRYCRGVTRVWCGFFIVNGLVALVLALAAPLAWWAAWTGLVAYLLMGLMFVVEVLVRFRRFHRTGMPWLDKILVRFVPRRPTVTP